VAPGGALLLCVCGLFAISSFRRKQADEEHEEAGEEEAEEAFIPEEEAERTATMADSFAVLNKGNAVIGNEKRPCVLNLKMHLVVPDEEGGEGESRSGVTSSPRPVTAQSSLSAQHSSPPAASADTGQCLVSYP
jgi:hypothetical protein